VIASLERLHARQIAGKAGKAGPLERIARHRSFIRHICLNSFRNPDPLLLKRA
jgi:hypothetical protein